MRHLPLPAALLTASAFGCITIQEVTPGGGPPGSSPTGDGAAAAQVLPCDVAAVMQNNCVSCHSSPSTPPALATYADLTAKSTSHPSNTVAEDCVASMMSTSSPMPPNGTLPAIDVQSLQAWITAGYPSGTGCGVTSDAGTTTTNDSGTTTTKDSGTSTKDSGTPPPSDAGGAPTWTEIFNTYLASGTVGDCASCHSAGSSASSLYTWMQGKGYISGTSSTIVKTGSSDLSWYGGNMPPSGPSSDPGAVTMMNAWVAAGALNN